MSVREFAPHPLLALYVHSVSYTERRFAPPNDSFDIMPDSMIELVYSFGASCRLADDAQPLPACYLVGLLEGPVRIVASGVVQTLRARLYPWGLLLLLGAGLGAAPPWRARGLMGAGARLEQMTTPLAAALAAGSEHAVDALQRALLDLTLTQTLHDAAFVAAARRLLAEQGKVTIADLAQATGLSPRALRRTFGAQLGIAPKQLARTARFEYVRNSLWEHPDTALAELALRAGYADQSHMQREFRRFSQRTPQQFADEMRRMRLLLSAQDGRNVQDL